jgi:uncharacterized protein YjbI with pentapeptide repeats
VRAMERVSRELERRASNPDEGWDERDALKHWAQICGPSAMSGYLHTFLTNEVRLRSHTELEGWQEQVARLFNFVLRHAMPMEQLQLATFREAMLQSRNAEEALLVALNVCAQTIGRRSVIQQPEPTIFGTWLMRIVGQSHSTGRLALSSLSFLTLPGADLFSNNLDSARLVSSDLEGAQANFLCAGIGDLSNTNFRNASLVRADFFHSNLSNANFERATLHDIDMRWANLEGANFGEADLTRADLTDANLTDANLTGANLTEADLRGANFTGANLEETNLKDVKMDERVAEQIREIKAKQTSK